MKKYSKKNQSASGPLDSNPSAYRQAPLAEILQAYRKNISGKQPLQYKNRQGENTFHINTQKQFPVKAVFQRYGSENIPHDTSAENIDSIPDKQPAQTDKSTHNIPYGLKANPSAIVQCKGEFEAASNVNPDKAKAIVKTDYSGYATYQTEFEKGLGIGLHTDEQAIAGADIMLAKMKNAMLKAGFMEEGIKNAFAVGKVSTKTDLGGILVDDVEEAIASGNLREKMGMVYQARFDISTALDLLRKPENQSKVPLGEEIRSKEMGEALDDLESEKHVSRVILNRLDIVSGQNRKSNMQEKRKLITGSLLADRGVPLSDREKRASKKQIQDGVEDWRFIPGSEYYRIDVEQQKSEQDQLRKVVAGLSGSTDMYFHIALHLGMNEAERELLRLAALGQMIVNEDHSYHEIMYVANLRGGLTDYKGDLPIGYTTLSPFDKNKILKTANMEDFPGDAQIRNANLAALSTNEEIMAKIGGDISDRSKKFRHIIALVEAYHKNARSKTLRKIIRKIDKWYEARKPAETAGNEKQIKWLNSRRRKTLENLKVQAMQLLAIADLKLSMDVRSAKLDILAQIEEAPAEKKSFVTKKMLNFTNQYIHKMQKEGDSDRTAQLSEKIQEMEDLKKYLKTLELPRQTSPWERWTNKDFRAFKEDLVDLRDVNIGENDFLTPYADKDNPCKGDLPKLLKDSVIESRKIMEAFGKDVSDIPDMVERPHFQSEFQKRMWENAQKSEAETEIKSTKYAKDNTDFIDNIDISMLEALKPGSPIENLLRYIEGKPVSQELQALQAYAQPGFYKMMNKILHRSKDMFFMQRVPPQAISLISLAISGLRKMKPYTGGAVFRGEPGKLKTKYINDEFVVLPKAERQQILEQKYMGSKTYSQFVSTSKRAYSSYICKDNNWLAIEMRDVKTGVDISAFSNTLYEREVLFPPGATFTIERVEDKFITKSKSGSGNDTDIENKYKDAPIGFQQAGRIKVVMSET